MPEPDPDWDRPDAGDGPPPIGRAVDPPDPGDRPGAPDPAATPSNSSTFWDVMTSTEPDPDLRSVSSPWDPDNGGWSRVSRAVQKMTGRTVSGLPAGLDLLIGLLEVLAEQQGATGDVDEPDAGDGDAPASEIDEVLGKR